MKKLIVIIMMLAGLFAFSSCESETPQNPTPTPTTFKNESDFLLHIQREKLAILEDPQREDPNNLKNLQKYSILKNLPKGSIVRMEVSDLLVAVSYSASPQSSSQKESEERVALIYYRWEDGMDSLEKALLQNQMETFEDRENTYFLNVKDIGKVFYFFHDGHMFHLHVPNGFAEEMKETGVEIFDFEKILPD